MSEESSDCGFISVVNYGMALIASQKRLMLECIEHGLGDCIGFNVTTEARPVVGFNVITEARPIMEEASKIAARKHVH